MKRKSIIGLAVAALITVMTLVGVLVPRAAAEESLFDGAIPSIQADVDTRSVELGVRFRSTVDGEISGLRFYKSAWNTGQHIGTLWSDDGQRLASVKFTDETVSGWQTATFDEPIAVSRNTFYRASYLAPTGRYAGDVHGFDTEYRNGNFVVPAGGGVYKYGSGGFPTEVWNNSNYYVDVIFSGGTTTTPGDSVSPAPTPTTTPTTPTPTTTPTTTPTLTPTPTTDPSTPGDSTLALPRVAWEGGSSYYSAFPNSKGFTDPKVFPIGVWWGDFDSDANVKWDKDHGINFYVQLNGTEDGRLLARNNMFWVGSEPLRNMSANDPAWAGWWLSDETDGRFSAAEGQALVSREIAAQKGPYCANTSCRFAYANYTGIVTSNFNAPQIKAAENYVNMYDGPVSVDGYYYTDPSCGSASHVDYQINAPKKSYCRTSAAYGNFIDNLRTRDKVDGKLKPLWGFVENGAPNSDNGIYIQPEQMKGAVMSMIVNEARGIVWFNQSFAGSCQSGNVIRDAQARPTGCNATRVQAMKEINTFVQGLAPVLNTQSYAWDFKTGGAETMLKVSDGSAYVFSSVALNANPGTKSFTLPDGIDGTSVEVVGENRTIPVVNGAFTDTFAKESSYHVYKISLNG